MMKTLIAAIVTLTIFSLTGCNSASDTNQIEDAPAQEQGATQGEAQETADPVVSTPDTEVDDASPNQPIAAPSNGLCPDGAEIARMTLELVNAARAKPRTCGDRQFQATTPVVWSNAVAQISYAHSLDMSGTNFFSHTGSNGLSPGDRLTNGGYIWRAYAENIAAGYRTVSATVEGWLDSPGHCANIMNPNVTEMGVACAYNAGSTYGVYWTQKFATPR